MLTNEIIITALQDKFPASILHTEESYGMISIEVVPSDIAFVIEYLKNTPPFNFGFLTDVCGIHYPDTIGKEIGVIYHLHNLMDNSRIRIKAFMPAANPSIPTVSHLFSSANWQERETYDFFGVQFQGHPNLKRILNVDHMDYFPMLKHYPLEDDTRTDKDDTFFGRDTTI